MSTKTTIKRVALVAAVALTLGGFSAVSASAATNTALYVYTADGVATGTGTLAAANGVAGSSNTVQVKVLKDATKRTSVEITGGTISTSATDSGTATTFNATSGATIATVSAGAANDYAILTIPTPVAGTITLTSKLESGASTGIYSATVAETVTFTVLAAGVANVLSVAASSVYGYAADSATPSASINSTTDAAFDLTTSGVAAGASTTPVATFSVTEKDANAAALTSGWKAITVQTTLGNVQSTRTTNAGSYVAVTPSNSNPVYFYVAPDGRSGVATVTVSINGVVAKTYSVKFYSTTVSSLTVSAKNNNVAAAAATGYVAAGKAVKVVALDSNGNTIDNAGNARGLTATSSDATVATAGTPAWDATDLVTYVPITAVAVGSATITVKDSTGLISGTAVINVTKAGIASIALSFDSATPAVGDKVTATLTAKDSNGKAVADGTYNGIFAGPFVSSASLTNTIFDTAVTFVGGVATKTFYAPLSGGTVNFTGTLSSSALLATALQATDVTGAVVVAGSADSALAVDAANAATDAANAAAEEASNATEAASEALAAVNALATTVASLIAGIKKQLVALTALVKKLQK